MAVSTGPGTDAGARVGVFTPVVCVITGLLPAGCVTTDSVACVDTVFTSLLVSGGGEDGEWGGGRGAGLEGAGELTTGPVG